MKYNNVSNVSNKLNNHIEQRSRCELEQLERIRQFEIEQGKKEVETHCDSDSHLLPEEPKIL